MSLLTNWLTQPFQCLADIPVHLQVNLATSGFVEEQEEGGSERTQCDSGQGQRPPVAVGTRLRKLAALSGPIHLREEKESFTWEKHTHTWMR